MSEQARNSSIEPCIEAFSIGPLPFGLQLMIPPSDHPMLQCVRKLDSHMLYYTGPVSIGWSLPFGLWFGSLVSGWAHQESSLIAGVSYDKGDMHPIPQGGRQQWPTSGSSGNGGRRRRPVATTVVASNSGVAHSQASAHGTHLRWPPRTGGLVNQTRVYEVANPRKQRRIILMILDLSAQRATKLEE